MLAGTARWADLCQPAWSSNRTAWRLGSILAASGCQVLGHGVGVAPTHDPGRAQAVFGADGTEDVSRRRARDLRCGGPGAAFGPAPGQLVLLAGAGGTGQGSACKAGEKPVEGPSPNQTSRPAGSNQGVRPRLDALLARNRVQAGCDVVSKASIAPSACAGWRGRAGGQLAVVQARNSRLSVCLATVTPCSSHSHWHRSTSRQRTTPCTAGVGPPSIAAAIAARCAS